MSMAGAQWFWDFLLCVYVVLGTAAYFVLRTPVDLEHLDPFEPWDKRTKMRMRVRTAFLRRLRIQASANLVGMTFGVGGFALHNAFTFLFGMAHHSLRGRLLRSIDSDAHRRFIW